MSDHEAKTKPHGAESLSTAGLERTFADHWALVRHGNPALADDVFAEALARTAWDSAATAACAKLRTDIKALRERVRLRGHADQAWHKKWETIGMELDELLRSNAELRGRPLADGPA